MSERVKVSIHSPSFRFSMAIRSRSLSEAQKRKSAKAAHMDAPLSEVDLFL